MHESEGDASLDAALPVRGTEPEELLLDLRQKGQSDEQQQGEDRREPRVLKTDQVDVGRAVVAAEQRRPSPSQDRQ